MDLNIIGKFIANRRKQKDLTQVKLAEILNVSEKTISKWECGNGFPDTSLIMPLCKELNITANELLSGKLLTEEEYKTTAEENLIALKNQQEYTAKTLLSLECVIGYMSSLILFVSVFVASFIEMHFALRIFLIAFGLINFIVGVTFALIIEKDAGFYQCAKCKHKYIPKFKSVLLSMHYGRTRFMKCPNCGKKSWNKKVLTNTENKTTN